MFHPLKDLKIQSIIAIELKFDKFESYKACQKLIFWDFQNKIILNCGVIGN